MSRNELWYFTRTNKELIEICKEHRIAGWSGKRKKDLVAMILRHLEDANKVQPAPPAAQPKDPEAMEELDELLKKGAEKASLELKELYPDLHVVVFYDKEKQIDIGAPREWSSFEEMLREYNIVLDP